MRCCSLIISPFIVVLTIPGCILTLFINSKTVLMVSHSHVFLSQVFILCFVFSLKLFSWPEGKWEHSSPTPAVPDVWFKEDSSAPHPYPRKMKFICILYLTFKIILSCRMEYLYVLWYTSTVLNYLLLSRRCLASKIELSWGFWLWYNVGWMHCFSVGMGTQK